MPTDNKWEQLLDSLSSQVRPLVAEFVATTIKDVSEDAFEYAEDVTDVLMAWIIKNMEAEPYVISREITIVRATLQNMAIKHAINANTRTLAVVDTLIEILAKAIATALRVAMA